MIRVRINEIAKELGMKSMDVINHALELGLDVRAASSSIDINDAEKLMNYILTGENKSFAVNNNTDNKELLVEEISIKNNDLNVYSSSLNSSSINSIKIEILNTKNIKKLTWSFLYESNIYAIIGENGSGKSTFITSLAKLVQPSVLKHEFIGKGFDDSEIIYTLDEYEFKCQKNPNWNVSISKNKSISRLEGFFESSVLNGSRFKKIDIFLKNIEIEDGDVITDSNSFIIKNMNYILTGSEIGKFDNLKKVSAKRKRKKINSEQYQDVQYSFYAINNGSSYVKEFFLSTGEYFLLSILKFLSSMLRKENKKPIIIIIDEIEISLHPLAQKRLIEKLKQFKDEFNLLIIFATHSLHIIDNIQPKNIYYLERDINDVCVFSSPIYPAYLQSKLYNNISFDKVILTEDILAISFIKKILVDFEIPKMRYTILPIGGWEKVIEIHTMHNVQKIFGEASVISILDGDTKNYLNNSHKKVNHNFLPIKNIEYVVTNYLANNDTHFLSFFNQQIQPHDLSQIQLEIKINNTEERKNTYKKLLNEVEKLKFNRNIMENDIIQYIIKDIQFKEDILKFTHVLKDFFNIEK